MTDFAIKVAAYGGIAGLVFCLLFILGLVGSAVFAVIMGRIPWEKAK